MASPVGPDRSVAARPVGGAERIAVIDVLRGVALLGILLVNMGAFSHPVMLVLSGRLPTPTALDAIADAFVTFFATGKFYSLFSFLFGVGLVVQSSRAEERGETPTWRLVRRQVALLGFGLLHGLFVWSGDILALYGLLGLVLLLFRTRRPAVLLAWALALVVVPLLGVGALLGLLELAVEYVPGGREDLAYGALRPLRR